MSINEEETRENLTLQVDELEALQSAYPTELIVADHGVLADINHFLQCLTKELPQRLEYSIEISIIGGTIELLVSLPSNYPKKKPEVYARSSFLNRTEQLRLNESLSTIVEQQEEGEPCIYTLISWVQDNGENYLTTSETNPEKRQKDQERKKEETNSVICARYWIYSHHIYSKFKRRDIADLAKENSITGFCLAGKPGIVCMEGAFEDCEYCWQKIKSMNWHKILIKLLEKEECENVDDSRKFADFQQLSFPTFERHNDMGHLLKYLTEHKSQYAFKELFGIEGKSTELPDCS